MDKNRFDGFTRQLAKRESRRQAIKTLFAGGAATAATVLIGGETDAKVDCCPADHPKLCNLVCTDTITDSHNCGGCGITCPDGQHCYKSACESDAIVHCSVAADCPTPANECQIRACKQGICGVTFAANGKKTTVQTAGDCQKNVCDGAGHIITIADNTDKPAASGECTTGVCVDGVPHQNALPSGRKCTNGKCDGAGHCSGSGTGGCTSANDCPATGNECVARTCVGGVCGTTNVASGTPLVVQSVGDCKITVCNGSGGTTTQADDTDLPALIPCTTSTCTNGVPSNSPVSPGTVCNGGVCDASGNCVACLVPSDCAGTDTECATRTCSNGVCGTSFVASGTPTSNQTQWDCKTNVCDGAGNIISVNDDTDFEPPYYDTPCVDSTCANGVPSHPFLAAGTPCLGVGGVCDGAGKCVQCVDGTSCPAPLPNSVATCIDGNCAYQCIPGYTDCPNGVGCINTSTDPQNCGACGHACSIPNGYALCANGACSLAGCDAGYADCNNDPADGCEVHIGSDFNNCGACNNQCAAGKSCISGTCQ